MIDHEVRLCDRDELYIIEKNKDIEKYANKLSEFKQKSYELPDESCFKPIKFQRELSDHMAQFQRELSSAKDRFLKGLQEVSPFPNPNQLNVVANPFATFSKDKDKSSIRGVVPSTKTPTLYLL